MKSIIADPDASVEKKKKAANVLAITQDVRQGEIDLEKAKAEGKTEAAARFQGDENATSPQAFLASLKPGDRAIVKMIGTGQMDIGRLEYLAARNPDLLKSVAVSFPNFDKSKVNKYVQASKEYASLKPGTPGAALNAGNAVLGHLERLKEIADTHPIDVRTPKTDANLGYNNLLNTIVGELTTFYQDPKTDKSLAGFKDNLSTFFGSRDAQIKEQIKAMGVKMDSYEQSWKEAAPSEAYEAPMPKMTPHAYQIMVQNDPSYAERHPELTAPANRVANTQSQGKIGVEAGGKIHYFNTQAEANNFKKLAGIH